jgi:hypothetical protein
VVLVFSKSVSHFPLLEFDSKTRIFDKGNHFAPKFAVILRSTVSGFSLLLMLGRGYILYYY